LFGAHAVELIASGKLGRMVAWQGSQITDIPLADAVGRLKTVPLESNLIQTARALGITLGD
jgi:6-phosphofructokinase 1